MIATGVGDGAGELWTWSVLATGDLVSRLRRGGKENLGVDLGIPLSVVTGVVLGISLGTVIGVGGVCLIENSPQPK